MRTAARVLLLCALAVSGLVLSSAADAAPRRIVNVNFNGLFSGASGASLAPGGDALVEANSGASCSPPGVEQTEVNVNFDGMLREFSQACQQQADVRRK